MPETPKHVAKYRAIGMSGDFTLYWPMHTPDVMCHNMCTCALLLML